MVFEDGGTVHAGEHGEFARKRGDDVHGIAAAGEGLGVETEFRMHSACALVIQKDTSAVRIAFEIFVSVDGDGEIVRIRLTLPVEIGETNAFRLFQTDVETAAAPSAKEAAVMLMLCDMDFVFRHVYAA